VPGCGDVYRAAYAWKDFQTIVEDATDDGPGDDKPKLSLSASPSGGDVAAGTKVYLTAKANSSTVSGASIYYTLNGTSPSKSSTAYTSSGITINASCTLKAVAYKDGYEDSDVMEEFYTVKNDGVVINETNFPDENFRNFLLSESYGTDGMLTGAEISEIDYIDVSDMGIKSLKGIEYFSALMYLWCDENQLTEIDVSKNTALAEFSCYNNQLKTLDISNNTALDYLDCGLNQLTALDVSKNTALTGLSCDYNQLTALDVWKNKALTGLFCDGNHLKSLDVSKNTALISLGCYDNMIKEAAMDALVNSLPLNSTDSVHTFYVINMAGKEGNVCTKNQVAVAKAKGWTTKCWNGTEWVEYEGGDSVEPFEKCATPTISYVGGKLQFTCETEGVEFVYDVKCDDAVKGTGANVSLTKKYIVTVYATKSGYDNSDVATKEINVGGSSDKKGDVNGDGEVGMPDVMFIVNYILNGKFPEE